MLGFSEPPYSVLQKRRRALWGNVSGTQFFELRQHGDSIPYIAMYTVNKKGKQFKDDLFMYDDGSQVADDWAVLTDRGKVRPHDLGYRERIVEHSTGYGRDGSVTVYVG